MAEYEEDAFGNVYSPDHYVSPQPKKPYYIPESLEMKSYMLSLENVYSALVDTIHRCQNLPATRIMGHKWRALEAHEPKMIMQVILEYVFQKRVEGRSYDGQFHDTFEELMPTFRQLGLDHEVAIFIITNTYNQLVATIGNLFPEMRFGDMKKVSFDLSGNTNLYITVSNDLSA